MQTCKIEERGHGVVSHCGVWSWHLPKKLLWFAIACFLRFGSRYRAAWARSRARSRRRPLRVLRRSQASSWTDLHHLLSRSMSMKSASGVRLYKCCWLTANFDVCYLSHTVPDPSAKVSRKLLRVARMVSAARSVSKRRYPSSNVQMYLDDVQFTRACSSVPFIRSY